MATRRHVHEEVFSADPATLFAILHTPSAIRGWWGASSAIVLRKQGGMWAATWGHEDDPEFITVATLQVFDPPRRLVLGEYRYFAKTGPLPFDADFTTEFVVEPHPSGARLRVTQDGFPMDACADGFYAACETGWRNTFAGIRAYLDANAKSAVQ
jgi:uncharacterized protein YndB with AHSA1/START domain